MSSTFQVQEPRAMEAELENAVIEHVEADSRLQDKHDVIIDIMDDFSLNRCDFPPCFGIDSYSQGNGLVSINAGPALFDGLIDFINHKFTSCKELGNLNQHAPSTLQPKSGCSDFV